MAFYDPKRCPDCGADLPATPSRCDACDLPLTGPIAVQLQGALRYADQLLVQLRRPVPAPATPYPTPGPEPRPARRGLRGASVPAVLLGLGALCLLVAALIFLAVAWSWLGIGGRTAVLLGLTAASGAAGLLLGARGLRGAAEALVVVALGLLLLDVAGAGRAGWLGTHPGGLPLEVYGGVLLAAGLVLLSHPLRLLATQAAASAGLGLLLIGLVEQTDRLRLLAFAGVLAFAALAWTGRALRALALPWLALAGATLSWLLLTGASLSRGLDDPTLAGLWAEGRVLGLLAAAALLALPAAYAGFRPAVGQPCLALAATLLTATAILPAADETRTVLTLVAGGASLLWAAVAVLHQRRWVLAPLALVSLPLLATAADLAGRAMLRLSDLGEPFTQDAGLRLPERVVEPYPVLLAPAVLVLALSVLAAVPPSRRRRVGPVAAGAVALAALTTPALFAAPLAAVLLPLAGLGAAVTLLLARRHRELAGPGLAGPVLVAATVLVALPSATLTAATASVLTALAALLTLRGRPEVRRCGGALLPPALAVTAWAGGEVAGLDPSYRSLLVLVLVAALALRRPRPETEVAAGLAALVAALAGIDSTTSLAVHLTLAGVLVTTSSLLHRDRRVLAWPGGLLLAAATWVRLAEIGVEAPEAYTLPSAVALVLVGLYRLHGDERSATTGTLLPGLVLATVPSLAWVLADPLTLRAALLGAACLALVLLGARLRWSAPLLVGGAVGVAVVLREAAPYLAETPQWVLIGAAGALLTGVGVTWERRVLELRRAGAYVGRLR